MSITNTTKAKRIVDDAFERTGLGLTVRTARCRELLVNAFVAELIAKDRLARGQRKQAGTKLVSRRFLRGAVL